MKRNMKTLDERLSGRPKHEPERSESMDQMIIEMRGHLQAGFALIESIWARCLGNRELATGIEDPDEFAEIQEAAENLEEIAADILSMANTGNSHFGALKASPAPVSEAPDYPPDHRKDCFGAHPGGIEAQCLLCPDEGDCDTATKPHTFNSEYDEDCECDPGGKKYRFKCPHCGGDTISEELKAYARLFCRLSGEFDPMDPHSYELVFAEPLDDPWNGVKYWCGKCGKNVLRAATRRDLRAWLVANDMEVKESTVDLP